MSLLVLLKRKEIGVDVLLREEEDDTWNGSVSSKDQTHHPEASSHRSGVSRTCLVVEPVCSVQTECGVYETQPHQHPSEDLVAFEEGGLIAVGAIACGAQSTGGEDQANAVNGGRNEDYDWWKTDEK